MYRLPYYGAKKGTDGKYKQNYKTLKTRCGFERCQQEFTTRDPNKTFCSEKCRMNYHNLRRRRERVQRG